MSYYLAVISHSYSQLLATVSLLSVCINFPLLDIAYKWNHTWCVIFCVWHFSPTLTFCGFPYTVHTSVLSSHLLWSRTPLYLGTAHFVCAVSGRWTFWVVSSLELS